MVICYYCGVKQRLDHLERHCRNKHNDVERLLEDGQPPLRLHIHNFNAYIDNPAIDPDMIKCVAWYWNKDGIKKENKAAVIFDETNTQISTFKDDPST